MIRLEVQPYCQECLDFEADVDKAELISDGSVRRLQSDTIVRYERRRRCESIRKFLEQKMKGDAES